VHLIPWVTKRGIEVKYLIMMFCGAALSGCASTSFAPPSTNLANELEVRGSNSIWGARCMPNERINPTTKAPIPIAHTAAGSQVLIDNFIYIYRCRAHSAANGRQGFEIPSILIAAGSATALALGAPSEVAIGGGAATSLLGTGKSYYAPQAKAEIFDSALDALLCIKTEAVGIDPITIDSISTAEKGGARGIASAARGVITVSAEERYFTTISAALLSVERVLAQRLSTVGTFDPAGVVAEIKALTEDENELTTESQKSAPEQAKALLIDASRGHMAAKNAAISSSETKIAQTIVRLETLQPKLQQCVVRAKI
jgi:hypothetical protein